MYIYLRVDIPIHHRSERIVSKYVLVTWQGTDSSPTGFNSDDEVEMWFGPPSNSSEGGPPTSNSKVQRALTAHIHGSEIYRVFPHHVRAAFAMLVGSVHLPLDVPAWIGPLLCE